MQKQTYLSEHELAEKWGISHRTLQRWRWLNQGPNYLKIGGHVRYRPEDVEAFEKKRLFQAEDNSNNDNANSSEEYGYSITLNGHKL
ncbi:MAG: helix-turn-helix domain-containing protein [Anaplasmataceae bacterium]|nr:helix-turn-helix domain-containing protein [Anaplasmataceae bacterium]